MIGAAITDIPGASAVFDRGFVTYSNQAKREMLNVTAKTIAQFGAVSGEVAEQMALGAIANSRAEFAVSVTGIAGPGGGTTQKPVGLVWFGYASRHGDSGAEQKLFEPISREAIRMDTTLTALKILSIQFEILSAG